MTDAFSSLMSGKPKDIEPPKALPPGVYEGVIEKYEEKVAKTGRPYIEFLVKLTSPVDVPEDAEIEPGALRSLPFRIFAKEGEDGKWTVGYSFRKAMEATGKSNVEFPRCIEESIGETVWAEVEQEPDQRDPEIIRNNIRGLLKAGG